MSNATGRRDEPEHHNFDFPMTIILASGNEHKLREVREILAPEGIEVLGAADVGGFPEVVEDRETFEGNAVKKAEECARAVGRTVLADDSGLAVAALDGAPGVWSARYAGEHGNHTANIARVLAELAGARDRSARFVCVLALATPAGVVGTVEGEVRGTLALEPRGSRGFGYDPIFIPEGHDRTFAQLPADVKNHLSHRGDALRKLVASGLLSP